MRRIAKIIARAARAYKAHSFLSIIGGVIGLIFVFLITFVDLGSFDLRISLTNVILGISISTIIGVFAGLIPAIFASRLDPVEAIRSN